MRINWVDDDAAKVVLANMGISTHEYIINVSHIDKKASKENRAREIALDESRIDGIRDAAEKGVPIPKIVVRRMGNKYVIAGGNHRFASINGSQTIPAHIIECTDHEFEIACRILNTVVGVGISKAERIASAAEAHERLGMTQKAAAELYGVRPNEVSKFLQVSNAQAKAKALMPTLKGNVLQTHIHKLGELANNDNVLRAACTAISETGMSAKEVAEVARQARQLTTEAQQVAAFEKYASERKGVSGKKIPRPNRNLLMSALSQLQKLKGKKTWESVEVEAWEIEVVREKVKDVVFMLNCLLKGNG
jgi:hypothetical protein